MRSERIRRLSILLGLLGLLGWFIFAFVVTERFKNVDAIKWQGWLILFAGLPTSFFLPFWVIRGIAWAVEGFSVAKRECPFCKEKVKENAIKCMHCKSELPPPPPKKWYQNRKRLLPIFLILFALGLFAMTFTSTESQVKNAVRRSLKDPASATFGRVTLVDDRHACVDINARNAYGGFVGNQQALVEKRYDSNNDWVLMTIVDWGHSECVKWAQERAARR
jgi:hypothetical protein